MSVTPASTPLIHQLTIASTSSLETGHYRSKLFITPKAANSFLSAAGPLFSLLERLGTTQQLPAIESVWENLDHELKAFQSRLQSFDSSGELLTIAQYLLCATVDELLGKSYLRLNEEPPKFPAFTPSSHDETGPEKRFFEIVDCLKSSPNQYLDLIELAYYCLISGFEGIEHLNTNGRQTLDNLIEELHEIIQKNRVSKPVRLFTKPKPYTEETPVDHKPWIKTLSLTVGALLGAYLFSQTLLEHKAKHILSTQSKLVRTQP